MCIFIGRPVGFRRIYGVEFQNFVCNNHIVHVVLPVHRAFVFYVLVAFVNGVLEDAHLCVSHGVGVFVW